MRPAGRSLIALGAVLIFLALPAAAGASHGRGGDRKVHITGTVYAFDNQAPIAGAKIRVAELPGAKATSAANGSYDLTVPDGARITPYVEATGFHGIYLQTFVTAGRNLRRVNFQVPSVGIYHGLALLLGVKLNADDNPARCVIVSTFSTVNVRDLSFPDFVAYGAHGVAGATASASPALTDPIYFNASVIPDKSLTESSVDGGVIWLNVPRGVYRLTAHHPSARFARFTATCVPGRLVNANPPQGLYQLKKGERLDNRVGASIDAIGVDSGETGPVRVRVGVRASEYVLPQAELLAGGRTVARAAAARYSPGHRSLLLRVGRARAHGSLRLRLTLGDAAGNTRVIQRSVQVP
ncbi:MAG: carboxypeptidase-like regulatory domain-containing protein [Solirubrobacterales bacterium]